MSSCDVWVCAKDTVPLCVTHQFVFFPNVLVKFGASSPSSPPSSCPWSPRSLPWSLHYPSCSLDHPSRPSSQHVTMVPSAGAGTQPFPICATRTKPPTTAVANGVLWEDGADWGAEMQDEAR